jgi:O-antigen/teichoic acid export membrane protein
MSRTVTLREGPASRFGAGRVYRDAASLASSSVANALLGVVFWAIAAKVIPPHDLGVMTAVLAVIVSVSLVISFGVGDAYTALLPAAGADRLSLYRRGQLVFLGLALTCGVGAAIATVSWLPEVRGSLGVAVLVAGGVLVWSAFSLQNSTLVALGRARWLPSINVVASVAKIALLLLLTATLTWHPVELSTLLPAIVLVAVLQPVITRVIHSADDLPPATAPHGVLVRRFNVFVGQTVLSSALSMGMLMITPFLVTAYSDPRQGALFALSLSMVQALDFIGGSLAMSLSVHASSSPDQSGVMARKIMLRAMLLCGAGVVPFVVLAPTALRLLNPEYGEMDATGVIALMAAGTVIRCAYMVWAALQRARRNMRTPLILNFISAIVLLVAMPVFTPSGGAFGGAKALMLTQLVLTGGIAIHFVATRRTLGRRKQRSAEVS